MTADEAKMQIQAIPEKIWDQLSEPDREAMDIAISALQAQEAKTQLSAEGTTSNLIGRQVAIDAIYKCTDIYINNLPIMIDKAEAYKAISELPPAEPEIVRCKDCKHRGEKPVADGRYWCNIHGAYMYYCSDAERRTDDANANT